jgi:tetratricopeptide (TPR) repeat protein
MVFSIPFLGGLSAARRKARQLTRRADVARDAGDRAAAAHLYEAALAFHSTAPIHIQCGHMLKELGQIERAETHYLAAKARMPDDADLNLQFGHFYKVCSRWSEAIVAYERAGELGLPAPIELSFAWRKRAVDVVGALLADTFDGDRYLELNPEVKAADMPPLDHFVRYGVLEGRATDQSAVWIELTKDLWDKGVRGR